MTSKYAVVGSPISQSLSPVIHLAAYRHLKLDFEYERYEVKLGELRRFFAEDFQGLSVTMPLKNEAFEISDVRDSYSEKTKAANTLLRRGSKIFGFNTDVFGIQQAISGIGVFQSAAIVGSGATARSAVLALAELNPATELFIIARDLSKAELLVNFAHSLGVAAKLQAFAIDSLIPVDLVISTLPSSVGEFWKTPNPYQQGWLLDVAYHPWPSKAAERWSNSQRVISGIEMLKWQAIAQIRLFSENLLSFEDSELYEVISTALAKSQIDLV